MRPMTPNATLIQLLPLAYNSSDEQFLSCCGNGYECAVLFAPGV
jgi:hypothetical protein